MKKLLLLFFVTVAIGVYVYWPFSEKQFHMARLFQDHAVLQRGVPVLVWGKAPAGEDVVVYFDGETYLAHSDTEGNWETSLLPHEAGGPYSIVAKCQGGRRRADDIYFGEVFLCAGQSNMRWKVEQMRIKPTDLSEVDFPLIRHFEVPEEGAELPRTDFSEGEWEMVGPDNVERLSAVAHFFSTQIFAEQNVPIGIVQSSYADSQIEAWMSAESLGFKNAEEAQFFTHMKMEEEEVSIEEKSDFREDEDDSEWHTIDWPDDDWPEMTLPGFWESQGLKGLNGEVWFRRDVTLPVFPKEGKANLHLARIDDSEEVFFNGEKIGESTGKYNALKVYPIPKKLLHSGRNVMALKVKDKTGDGGVFGEAEELKIQVGSTVFPLTGKWKFRVAKMKKLEHHHVSKIPARLFNGMISPLNNFPLKGVVWYQGESDVRPENASRYGDRLVSLIEDWRMGWGLPELPFVIVQLANYDPFKFRPSDWVSVRSGQLIARQKLPQTAIVVTADLGLTKDVHSPMKKPIGERAAKAMSGLVYEVKKPTEGPVVSDASFSENEAVVYFQNVGDGLRMQPQAANYRLFEIGGKEGLFFVADIKIKYDKVYLKNTEVPRPEVVRYAWKNNPRGPKLYNSEGLPASPFLVKKSEVDSSGTMN